jgi:PAS domain S-box-containing protein
MDINDLKSNEQATAVERDCAETVVNTARDPLVILDEDLRVHTANKAFYETFKVSPAESVGSLIYELGNGQWQIPKLRQLLEEILPRKSFVNNFEVTHDFESIGRRTMLLNARPLSAPNQPARILLGIEDMTDAVSFQSAARENEEKFRLLFQRSPLPKWVVDLETLGFLDVNQAAVEHYGYSREEFLRMSVLDVRTPEAGEALQAALARPPHRPSERDTCQHRKKNGEIINVEVRSNEFMLAGKRVWLASITDITESTRAEEAFRKSEQRFAQFMRHLPALAWIKDSHGRYVFANDAAERAFGKGQAELYGKTDQELFPPETADQFVKNDQKALASEAGLQTVETLAHADGSLHYSIASKFPVHGPNDKEIMVGGVAFDITKRKQAEEAQKQLTEQLAAELAATQELQHTSTQLIREGDPNALYQQIVKAAVTIMHSDMASIQMVEASQDALRLLASEGLDSAFGQIFESSDPEAPCSAARRAGHRVIVPNVESCDFMMGTTVLQNYRKIGIRAVQSTPLVSRAGPILGVVSTYWRNPHQPAERDLRLLDILARQAADFIERVRAEESLREADRRKNEFLATLAHELRNPLAPILNSLEVLRRTEGNGKAVQSAVGMMDRQIGQMVRLVDDLLDVSRISRGKIELRKGSIELASVVNHAVEAARPLLESKGLDLTVTLPSQPVYLNADPTRLAQVVGNLLSNAAKFTDKGGCVWLTAELAGEGHQSIEEVLILVRDTGIGIAADQLPRIFDMFIQVDTSLERSTGGLGIGLTLAKNLVELHGGTLEAYSAGIGQGSEFVVRLPILVEAPKLPQLEPAVGVPRVTTVRRVLVVEDNRDSIESLTMLLNLAGYETHAAKDGLEATEAAATFRPDVILLDIGLPKLNGYEVARKIREQPWGRGMVLVALTGWGQEEDRRRSQEAGFNHHLTKPVDPDTLSKLLARIPITESAG